MTQHTVASFDADLKTLAGMIGEIGSRAGHALADATKALLERNVQLAQQVIAADRNIDDLQHQIEERAVTTIAKRQPMAVDLREIIYEHAGGIPNGRKLKGVIPGGASMPIFTADETFTLAESGSGRPAQ